MSLSSYSSPEHAVSLQGGSRGGQLHVHNSYRPLVSQVPMSELEHNIHPNRLYNRSQHQVLGYRPIFPDHNSRRGVIGYAYNNRGSRPVRTSVVVGRIPAGSTVSSEGYLHESDAGDGDPNGHLLGSHGPAGRKSQPPPGQPEDQHHRRNGKDGEEGGVRPTPFEYPDDRSGGLPKGPAAPSGTTTADAHNRDQQQQHPRVPSDSNATPQLPSGANAAVPPDVTPIKSVTVPATPQHAAPLAHHPIPKDSGAPSAAVPPTHDHPHHAPNKASIANAGRHPDGDGPPPGSHVEAAATSHEIPPSGSLGGAVPSLCGHRFSRPGDKFCAECGDTLDWYCAGGRGVVQQPIPHTTVRLSNSIGPSLMASAPYRPVATLVEPPEPHPYKSQLLTYNEHPIASSHAPDAGALHYQLGGYGPVPTFRSVYDGQGPVLSPRRSYSHNGTMNCTCGSRLMGSATCTCSFH
ncbi:Hypothetical protein, putative [Bodo saltans]|uniref:Uncharacterized protein n=1 Tax=Bodo saltans TaxID=75058 RepID=A0A0S4ISS6_BODSA|nr:Hypothetical protein, putative [Bodo saltans]|eukprot:CUE72872.1 Hypothetical protein, putative [Bodo saltans]